MDVDPTALADLRARAAQASGASGHDVQVLASPDAASVTLTIDGTAVSGPDPWDDTTAHGLDRALAAIADRSLVIVLDGDGLPRVVSADELGSG